MRLKIERCDEVALTLDDVDEWRLDALGNLVVWHESAGFFRRRRRRTVSRYSWMNIEEMLVPKATSDD